MSLGVWPHIHIHGVFFGGGAFLRSPLLAQLQRDAPHAPDRGESRQYAVTQFSLFFLYWVPSPAATTLNFSEFSSPYSSMAGAADGLDPDGSNKSAFMEIQQQGLAGMAHHGQPYPIRSTYSAVAAPQHEAAFSSAQHPRPLGANPFPMNYNPLHNTYSHPSHPYLSTYPANVPTCPSPTRDGKYIKLHYFGILSPFYVLYSACLLSICSALSLVIRNGRRIDHIKHRPWANIEIWAQ